MVKTISMSPTYFMDECANASGLMRLKWQLVLAGGLTGSEFSYRLILDV